MENDKYISYQFLSEDASFIFSRVFAFIDTLATIEYIEQSGSHY